MKVSSILENRFLQNDQENELLQYDRTSMAKIGSQIASQAAVQFKGSRAKEKAEAAANKAYSVMLKSIDEYFNRLNMKGIN